MVSMRYGVLALVFAAPAAAMRVRPSNSDLLEKATTATIAGVPVLNYHLAFQGKSFRHVIHGSSASLVSLEINAKEEDWVIVLNTDIAEDQIHEACSKATAKCTIEGHASGRGFPFIALHGTEAELEQVLLATGGARFVEVDIPIGMIPEVQDNTIPSYGDEASEMVNDPLQWHLQKIGASRRAHIGKGVHVFVLDTGVLTTHHDFQGRATAFADTFSLFGYPTGLCKKEPISGGFGRRRSAPSDCAADRQGHGTHCAGTVGGATWGVAPGASLHAVKVMGDSGQGSLSAIISGMDLAASSPHKPAVLSMSLGGKGRDRAMLEAVSMVVSEGVTVVVAAGNEFADACGGVLAASPDAITVGATTSDNARAGFSNFGACVDIFAPGQDIWSADLNDPSMNGSVPLSGTSMACPAVAGAAALLLEGNPNLTPEEVRKNLLANAGSNYTNNLSPMDTTNNKLLYVGSDAPPPALSEPPADTVPWPTDGYWSACQGQGATGPWAIIGDGNPTNHHCKCDVLTKCTEQGLPCPLSETLEEMARQYPEIGGQMYGTYFAWTCTDCVCRGPFGGIR